MNGLFSLNKKGSAMVEAAIIYPLVIGTVMAVVYIIINMYTSSACKAHLNMELRKEAMRLSETGEIISVEGGFTANDKYSARAFGKKVSIVQRWENGRKRLYGGFENSYSGNSLLKGVKREHNAEIWLADEKQYIREVDFVSRE